MNVVKIAKHLILKRNINSNLLFHSSILRNNYSILAPKATSTTVKILNSGVNNYELRRYYAKKSKSKEKY